MDKRQQNREEERRILAEKQQGVKNGQTATQHSAASSGNASVIHCKRCKTVMEKGVCPNCGFRIYVPMDEQKRKKIRLILTGVCLVAFVILYFAFIK